MRKPQICVECLLSVEYVFLPVNAQAWTAYSTPLLSIPWRICSAYCFPGLADAQWYVCKAGNPLARRVLWGRIL